MWEFDNLGWCTYYYLEFLFYFLVFGFTAEEKKHKLSELKTGLDEAESLVWHCFSSISSYVSEWLLSFWGLGFELIHDWLFPICFGTMTRDLKVQWCGCLDLENGPWYTQPMTNRESHACKIVRIQVWLEQSETGFQEDVNGTWSCCIQEWAHGVMHGWSCYGVQ
jgi:hypothetical protein